MSNDLISRSALLEKMSELNGWDEYNPTIQLAQGVGACHKLVDFAPAVDAEPVVRGEWVAEQKGAEYCEFRCSACDGSVGQTDQFDETEVKQFSEWYKYCPACGAKMDGGATDET